MARDYLPIDSGKDENPLKTVWIPMIMTDPLLFQATTSFAAVHLDVLEGHQNQPKTLSKKCQTINMVNSKLQSRQEAITDSTIAAVAMLAAMEVSI